MGAKVVGVPVRDVGARFVLHVAVVAISVFVVSLVYVCLFGVCFGFGVSVGVGFIALLVTICVIGSVSGHESSL